MGTVSFKLEPSHLADIVRLSMEMPSLPPLIPQGSPWVGAPEARHPRWEPSGRVRGQKRRTQRPGIGAQLGQYHLDRRPGVGSGEQVGQGRRHPVA